MYEPMIAKVVHYQVGNKTFGSLKEAKQAAIERHAIEQLHTLLSQSINSSLTRTGNIDNVLKEILMERDAIRDILAAYGKKQPRAKKCAT